MIEPADLLLPATELSAGMTEGHWRSAVSRAYYSAYHAGVAWHSKMPVPGSVGHSKSVHEQLIQQLARPDNACKADQQKRSRVLSNQLRTLRAMRVQSDYHLSVAVLKSHAETACALAQSLVELPAP